jgi:predicted dehydrogenase
VSAQAAVVGFGLAGEVFHAPLIDAVDGLEVAAIVTSNPERQARARAAYPDARVVGALDELWGDGLDLIVVATPNRAHVPVALAAIEHDLPVVVDKPLAATVAEAERLLAAGGRLTVFQNRRWDGDFMTTARLARAGALGELLRFESRFERFRPQVSAEAWRELPDAEEGGGVLLDLGAHLVDQALALLGPAIRVHAEIDVRRPGAQVNDDAFVALEHASGARSHLAMTKTTALPAPRLRLSGLGGGLETFGLDPQEEQLGAGLRPGDPRYGIGNEGRIANAAGEVRPLELDRGAYERFYEGVVRWLAGGPLPVDPRDSLDGLRVLEAAGRSAAGHEVVELERSG